MVLSEEEKNPFVGNLTIIKAAVYSFLFTLGVFGNILVIRATTKYVSLRRPTNILICNLCVCDVIIMLIGIPMFVTGEEALVNVLGAVACMGMNSLFVAVITATVFTLITIAIERCDVIVNSVHTKLRMTTKKAFCVVASIDVASALLAVPLLFSKLKNGSSIRCERDWSETTHILYVSTLFLLQYIIPLFVMSLLYTVCWHKIRMKNKKTINLSTNNRTQTVRERSKSATEVDDHPVAVSKLLEEIAEATTNFLSGSNNHLSGSVGPVLAIRRSFSADSVCGYMRHKDKENSADVYDSAHFRRSATFHQIARETESIDRPGSVCDPPSSPSGKRSLLLINSTSLRGSVQKFQQSFTSLLIGTDTQTDSHTVFALQRIKQTLQTLKVFACILVIFAICMLPHHIADLMLATRYREKEPPLFSFLHLFIYINAAINPWIYAGMNKSYRLAYRGIFRNKTHLADMLRNNLFRTPSGRVVLHKSNAHSHMACLSKIFIPLCGRFVQRDSADEVEEETLAACRERGDTIKSLEGGYFRSRTFTTESRKEFRSRTFTSESRKDGRKDSRNSKDSRKTSTAISEYEIPVLAPIIIITCYDDEIAAAERECEEENFSKEVAL